MANTTERKHAHNFKDLTGRKFGRFVVDSYAFTKKKRAYWLCVCACGTSKHVCGGKLKSGTTRSCGCLHKEGVAALNASHGFAGTGKRRRAEYTSWAQMIQRCCNKNNSRWADYGGRGIKICDEWRESFEAFFNDVGPRPSPEHSIDRYPDNDGNYEPGNVKWSTRSEQAKNRRKFKRSKHTHCNKGHELSGDNVYPLKDGGRRCLTCKREYGASWARRKATLHD